MSEEKIVSVGPQKGDVVDLTERVTLYATAKNPYKKEGEEMKVGKLLVDSLINKGFASKTKTKLNK